MALKEIAVEGCTFKVTGATSSSVTNNGIASTKVKAEKKGAYSGGIPISVTASISGTCEGASGTGTISPTALKTKIENSLVNRQGDSVSIAVSGGVTPGGSSCGFTVSVEIDNPGQTKVKAE
jgi:hypothetical protein